MSLQKRKREERDTIKKKFKACNGTGIPIELFIQETKHFQCAICNDVSYPPRRTKCSHIFCERCIIEWTKLQNECPICRTPNPTPQADALVTRIVNDLLVTCFYKEKGCSFYGNLGDLLTTHEKECEYKLVQCKNAGCNERVERRNYAKHESTCPHRSIKCLFCSESYIFKNEKDHLAKCVEYPTFCPNQCGAQVKRKEIEKHFADCPLQIVECITQGCGAKVKRKDLGSHIQENSLQHFILMNNHITKLNNQLTECVLAIQQRDLHIQQLAQQVNQQNKKIQELNEKIERYEKGSNQRSNSPSQCSISKPKRLLNLSLDWRRAATAKYRK